MIKIKDMTVKNFLSVGNSTQSIRFDRNDLTLVLGQNIDLGGDDGGARNGVGKSLILNALSYALFGLSLSDIKRDNLINKTNSKNMLVTLDFEINNNTCRLERGRRPNILKFYTNGLEKISNDDDESQGDSRETQKEIERLLGMSHEMFRQIVALNTYSEPFLNLRSNDQRSIIEQLLGITQLSAKADKLKEQIKQTRDQITDEEYRIKAIQDTNKKINEQISSLEKRQKLWQKKKDEDIEGLAQSLVDLQDIDIDCEIEAHKQLALFYEKKQKLDLANRSKADLLNRKDREEKQLAKAKKDLETTEKHKCYACGQDLHDQAHEKILTSKKDAVKECEKHIADLEKLIADTEDQINILGEIGKMPKVFYDSLEKAMEHRSSMEKITMQLEQRLAEEDPYTEQISDMKNKALETISWDNINRLNRVKEHQEFLFKLLTNKDSFIRKTIIDQNLSYLNARLHHYLSQIGLPHQVKFLSDLTVEIQELGRELDFGNLSRGERNRLILSLSWAFRDVWEGLYQPINLLFIDEMLDSGMDSSGVDAGIIILKKMARERNKSIFLISHRDELANRVSNILTVSKEAGFTTFSNDIEIKK